MTAPKLCIDCAWARQRPTNIIAAEWWCANPAAQLPKVPDLVTGQTLPPADLPCVYARLSVAPCGPEGHFWTSKEPT